MPDFLLQLPIPFYRNVPLFAYCLKQFSVPSRHPPTYLPFYMLLQESSCFAMSPLDSILVSSFSFPHKIPQDLSPCPSDFASHMSPPTPACSATYPDACPPKIASFHSDIALAISRPFPLLPPPRTLAQVSS